MSRQRGAGASPLFQSLESRLALSAEVNANGVLVILGSPQADTVVIEAGSETGTAILTGVPGVPDGTVFSGFEDVRVDLKSGDDTFTSVGTLTNAVGFACDLDVRTGNGNDTITIGQDNSFVSANGGNAHDTINGGPSNETLRGGRGRDTIFGNEGFDTLHGGLGRDLLLGGNGRDTLNGGNQADELWGGIDIDILNGGPQRDVMWGGHGPDELTGGPARDTFNGAPGEALDFNPEDEGFDARFDQELNIVLFGPTFWDRFAEAEDEQTQRVDQTLLNAFDPFAESFRDGTIVGAAESLIEAMAGLQPGELSTLRTNLIAVTNEFSPDVLADPAGLTDARMLQLRDDLIAAGGNALQPSLEAYANSLFTALLDRGFVEAVNDLPASTTGTQAFLFAADSVFNLTDWP